jgi:hypothetical protein
MSRKPLVLMMWAVALVAMASPAWVQAMSVSQADLLFPSYGQARHFDQSFEYLGNVGQIPDGASWSTAPGLLNLTLLPNVGDQWGTGGDYEYLSVWIDWDLNRTFDAAELVVDLQDEWFDFGIHPRTFQVAMPTTADPDLTWMRTRFSFDGPFGPTGDLITGEVEDYLLSSAVPEPTSLALLVFAGLGALAMRGVRRRRC